MTKLKGVEIEENSVGETLTFSTSEGYKIKLIKSCISKKKAITVEAELKHPINLKKAHEKLKFAGMGEVNFSDSLGVIKINQFGKIIMIFSHGEISVRKARDKEDAIKTIEKIIDLITPGK